MLAILVLAWNKSGTSQTQELSAKASGTGNQPAAVTPPSATDSQAAAELAKQASNPLSSAWLIQVQQNNGWVGMPLNEGDRVDSDLLLQPLLSVKLTDEWTLLARPILTLFNSTPYVDASGLDQRTTGFGDMVLALALSPRPLLKGRLTLAAGPTFIFPTATDNLLGQQNWQAGPDVGVVVSGKRYLAFVFPQQWFKIGGNGPKTNQLSAIYDFTYFLKDGWNVGTEPNLSVDWQAPRSQRVSFPIGPQVGKLCKWGRTPTLIQLQFEYYPVHPTLYSPKWNVQLQITPTIPSLLKGKIF
ncbi:MAG TPA: hypothetical protein VGD64_11025 [Acidisarcina sp.]